MPLIQIANHRPSPIFSPYTSRRRRRRRARVILSSCGRTAANSRCISNQIIQEFYQTCSLIMLCYSGSLQQFFQCLPCCVNTHSLQSISQQTNQSCNLSDSEKNCKRQWRSQKGIWVGGVQNPLQ